MRATSPRDRLNPVPSGRYDVVVLGAGAAGLVASGILGATQARVALIEANALGGDCTHVGCVPSKALLHVSSQVAAAQRAIESGWLDGRVEADGAAALRHLREVRADVAASDGVERFEELGAEVFFGRASFPDANRVRVSPGEQSPSPVVELEFDKLILANGSTPLLPPIEGLDGVDALTNETVFELDEPPRSMVIIGAGPIGCELGQAFCRLGVEITIVEASERILPRDDPRAGEVVAEVLTREGVNLLTGRSVDRIEQTTSGVEVRAGDATVRAERVLLAVGRAAPGDPGYAALGVEVDRGGFPIVDAHLRTTAPHVHAVGDVALRSRFTHMAAQSAMNAVTDQLVPFMSPTIDQDEAPWCTFTEPAVGHVGLTPAVAEARGLELRCHEVELSEVDRAVINGDTEGFVRLYTRRGSSRIVGATVVSRDAGEMISQLALARSAGVGLLRLAGVTYPYPSMSQAYQNIGQEDLLRHRDRAAPILRAMWSVRRAAAGLRRRYRDGS